VIHDIAIIGGGIVGLSTARTLVERAPGTSVLLVEKELGWGRHQTGNNSGVIHSGLYYKPGSHKARFARAGSRSMVEFCREHGIAHEVCGKLVVATEPEELPLLDALHERGLANELPVRRIAASEIADFEPHVRGLAALHVASTGIVDYGQVAETYARLAVAGGARLVQGAKVHGIHHRTDAVTLETTAGEFRTRFVVNCAGLHSDRIARLEGARTDMRIVPFRGEYYELVPQRRSLVRNLVYPVPNPNFPFLGVHFTRMIDGTVHAGPNAVLATKREGYRKRDVDLRDLAEVLGYRAFWKLARANAGEGLKEVWRSVSRRAFVRSMQRMIPEITIDDVVPTHAGVRAQALLDDGRLVDDFHFLPGERALHVCNAPSPAATASIEIGGAIADQVLGGPRATPTTTSTSNGRHTP